MNSELQQPGVLPPELNREQSATQERPDVEPDISETDLQRKIEQAVNEVGLSQSEVIAAANSRIKGVAQSSGLPAVQLYEQGGFADDVNVTTLKITELSEKAKTEVAELARHSPEVRDFTKQYSGFWRDRLAEKIRDARSQYREKQASFRAVNLERGVKRTELDAEIAILATEIGETDAKLESQKNELEKEKSRIAYRIANLIGRPKAMPNESIIQGMETESAELRTRLEEKRGLAKESEEIILDGHELKDARAEIDKFYEEQMGIQKVFEQEKASERDVATVSNEKGVLFLHALSLDGYVSTNTSENNPIIDTEKMTSLDKVRIVLGVEPAISVSTRNIIGENKVETMYPMGLIIGAGTVLSAYGGDAGTYADNPSVRRSQDDDRLKSAVQEDFSQNMKGALERELSMSSSGAVGSATAWNELVVENPMVSGVFIQMNSFGNEATRAVASMKQAFIMSKEFGLPVYGIRHNGEMLQFLSEDFSTIAQEEVLSYRCELGMDEKIQGVEKALETQAHPDPLIQQRLIEIGAQERSDEAFQKTQEIRAFYSGKAEEYLNALVYEGTVEWIMENLGQTDNIGIGLEEIIKLVVKPGVGEAGLQKINLLFGGKTPDEIRGVCNSILSTAAKLRGLMGSPENV